ncbi:hypothetical protein [Burkholderia pseudomallei]|uniref:hypothetical protein n=1 Tax=Burkholderia pseudomallei TaxID=28450 RepID=UPI0011AB3E30|nr:hypothetical protein [Burkholderia pseudomallei]
MTDKFVLDLESSIPPNALAATIEYKTQAGAQALLHRFDGDQYPIVLRGPSGTIEVSVSQSRKLYLERLDGADWEIGCSGYRF